MSERRRRPNGAAKRYKGPRELVGTRVPPEITDRVDAKRSDLGLTRNDYLFAALLVAFERPDEIQAAAATLADMLPNRRTSPENDQLHLAEGPPPHEEALRRSA
ncbi:hypothetical protein SAMN05216207_10733 [Pseudonocardia ammonioxydans]|uniref:Uncharacterized protein n=1 Tax=Pseudonocardia ammonioxydans TaxID=260086 RepID=A0A1I5HR38_PSUAM|nr:hypothetical protein [Pseudonocardia ammonioxydans]SFO50778.1 hypothetical protein SAMN05216207_10733 [Pseudonocardia ammonioxydans]